MINPLAVEDFLARKLRNSDHAKLFTERALSAKIARLDPQPDFVFEPMWHQKISFLLGLKYNSYFYILDMGLGKTKVVLDLFNYRVKIGKSSRLLVLVPSVSNVGGWKEEAETHTPNLTFQGLDESMGREERIAALQCGSQILCVTYQGWLSLICKSVPVRGKKGKSEWKIVEKLAREYEQLFDEVCFDESTALANHTSITFSAARRLMKTCHARSCLSGTPFNRDPTSLWSQFFVIDKGETLGPHLNLFRAAFFTEKDSYWGGGKEYTFDNRMLEDLYAMMRNRSVRFSEAECLDLPPKRGGLGDSPMIRHVTMPKETHTYYEKLVEELKEARGNYELMKNTYTRLRMLTAGFLPVTDPDTGERVEIIFKKNPKMDALVQLIHEIGDAKIIVFCCYSVTGTLIAERLTKEKIKHVRLYGKTSNKNEVIEKFKKDPKVKVLISSKSGAYGHNLQCANYMVFFESFDDPTTRRQAEKRTRRKGQTKTCFYYDIQMKGTIDERVFKSLQEGKTFFDLLIDGSRVV